MDTLCLSSLVDTIIDASYLFGYRERYTKNPVSNERMSMAYEAYAFISGTGLDKVIQFYGLDLDAERLRTNFESLWRRNGS